MSEQDGEKLLLAGAKIACTFFFKRFLPSNVSSIVRVLTSFNEPVELPYGWTVFPVFSGTAVTNWFFTHPLSSSILVCGKTSITRNCIYKTCFRGNTCDIIVQPKPNEKLPKNVTDLSSIGPEITVPDILTALAVGVQLASLHGGDTIVRIMATSPGTLEEFRTIPSLFEWLNEDMQVYLRKCVNIACERNEALNILSPCPTLHVGAEPIPDERFVVRIDSHSSTAFDIVGESSPEDIVNFYSAATLLSSGSIEVESLGVAEQVDCLTRDEIKRSVETRFTDATVSGDQKIGVPSLHAEAEIDDQGILKSFSRSIEDPTSLLHIVL